MLLEKWMKACEYRITEGSEHQWQCYGPDAYTLDSWNGHQDGHSFSIIFDKNDQTVYELQAHDYTNNRAYRWIDPDYKEAHSQDAVAHNVDANDACDDLKYVDLETTEDFFEKMSAIYEGRYYDTRVQVPLDLEDDLLFGLMKMAHERDITLNQMVEQLLLRVIDEHKDLVK